MSQARPHRTPIPSRRCLAALGLALIAAPALAAGPATPRIGGPVDDRVLVTLHGNTRPEANGDNDRGAVDDALFLDHMMLQLRRGAAEEAALVAYLDQLHDPASPNYHHWLDPEEIDARYGLAAPDLAAVETWLTGHGFTVNFIHANGMVIDFSGTAGQLREAFHTELHWLAFKGETHVANFGDPQIPAALAPVVAGIVTLHDFAPQPQFTYAGPLCENLAPVSFCEALVPADLATIYGLNPLFAAGIAGKGQTIAVVNVSDATHLGDWATFRKKFGLSGFTAGKVSLVHPQPRKGGLVCQDPGVNGAKDEAILDTEWASAAAPDAHIILATCKGMIVGESIATVEDALLRAVINLTEATGAARPQIINVSYGVCEAKAGATFQAAFLNAFQTAAAAGISVFVSAGDALSTMCDQGQSAATHGAAVNGIASTPYDVAVGGTDFADTLLGENATYWAATNSKTFGSAESYIPEIPWNGSCASALTAAFLESPFGAPGLCADAAGTPLAQIAGGGGGPSLCAAGAPATPGVVGGTCVGYAQPSFQSGFPGMPADGVRNLPDVALFAAGSPWGHSYVICASDQKGVCAPGWAGTSFASPIMAGIQALVNQSMHATEGTGNPNIGYYKLAAAEYGSATSLAACNSGKGSAVGAGCVFHDVSQGDIDAPCVALTVDCYAPDGSVGVLSFSTTAYEPAFPAAQGWDFATGLGSVNAANLVAQWPTVQP
jgi:subtilase family serine protease